MGINGAHDGHLLGMMLLGRPVGKWGMTMPTGDIACLNCGFIG
jgi:hypothetical protein